MRKNTSFRSALSLALALFCSATVPVFTHSINSTKKLTQHATYSGLTGTAAPSMEGLASAGDYLASVTQQGVYHWDPTKLPVKVYISPGKGVSGYRPEFASYIRNGFNQWTAVSDGKLGWKEVSSPQAADIDVEWTSNVTERPNGTEAGETNAYTRLDQASGQGIIYGAHMSLLTELPNRQFTDNEMEKTCIHECGHALGLQGHSPVPTDIMYYAINAQQQPALTARDRQTMEDLYANYTPGTAVAFK